jgi:UDP-N-acetyl-D-mannosaminuronic acid dehydrogenase
MRESDPAALPLAAGEAEEAGERLPAAGSVCVVGLGYIGLPTAAVLASRGIEVHGCDVDQKVVETINRGDIHIVEPELDVAVHGAVNSGFLRAGGTPQPAETFLIAVPTPFKEGHQPDLSYIQAAANAVAPVLEPGNLVILESTSPVGATEQLADWLAEKRPDLSFPQQVGEKAQIRVAHCPERVLPGNVLRELVDNDRVIGGMTTECSKKACEFYRTFVTGELVQTDIRTAELCKLSENAFRDVNIAFANELSLLCDSYGIDVWELIELANRHPRVNILKPGPGVGGHCIAVDPWFIISHSPDIARLMRAARDVNDYKPQYVVNKVREAIKGIDHPVIACLGLAFKADVDDLRESPALQVTEMLAGEQGTTVLVVEPNIVDLPDSLKAHGNVHLDTLQTALFRADAVVGLVRHQHFVDELSSSDLRSSRVLDFVHLFKD